MKQLNRNGITNIVNRSLETVCGLRPVVLRIEQSDDADNKKIKRNKKKKGSCKTLEKSPFSCDQCNQPIWGIKTKFKEFLKKHINNSVENEEMFNKIYNWRSKMVHTNFLLLGDGFTELINDKGDTAKNEYNVRLELFKYVKIGFTNWLILQDKNHKSKNI